MSVSRCWPAQSVGETTDSPLRRYSSFPVSHNGQSNMKKMQHPGSDSSNTSTAPKKKEIQCYEEAKRATKTKASPSKDISGLQMTKPYHDGGH